jgi:hypothetical protein
VTRTREKFKARKDTGWFFRVPVAVLDSPRYCQLTFKARALLFDLGAQYRGYNNGDLAAPWSWMKRRGWKSKDTLKRAIDELLAAGMIELTRQGGLHCPNLYAVTWLSIDECGGKLDIRANPVPSGKWKDSRVIENKTPQRPAGHTDPISGAQLQISGPVSGGHCPDIRT